MIRVILRQMLHTSSARLRRQFYPVVIALVALAVTTLPGAALAQKEATAPNGGGAADEAAELAKKLQNPVAKLISVPLQSNWDWGIGPANAMRYMLNVQPVIPFSLTTEWNLITRTIVPFIHAEGPVAAVDSVGGIGDILQSFFLSPSAPTSRGWIWGVGPVFLYPSASDDALGAEKWGAGPTAVFLRQDSGWTYGLLANHVWSFAGKDSRADVSTTFLQPFVSFITKTYTTFALNTESTYDWEHHDWTVPINFTVSQMLKLGGRPVQLQVGPRVYAERPDGGPDWGLRFSVIFLFPK